MKECIEVNGQVFTTKKSLEACVRAILDRTPIRASLGGDDLEFIKALMQRNAGPHRTADTVAAIIVERVPEDLSLRRFRYIRPDGSSSAFSWKKCISPPSHVKRVKAAMRALIADQIIAFKDRERARLGASFCCPIADAWLLTDAAHVDHARPDTFDALTSRFFADLAIDPELVELRSHDDAWADEIVDAVLSRQWCNYHRRNAVLRLVSPEANLSLLRRK